MTTPRRDDLTRALPYARRYARALTGGQRRGDALVAEGLRELLAPPDSGAGTAGLARAASAGEGAERAARHALYAAVTRRFDAGHPDGGRGGGEHGGGGHGGGEHEPAEALSRKQRQLLLLTALEEVPLDAAARIVGLRPPEAAERLAAARERLRAASATSVLIIEDEPIIAMDIEELVHSCGHRVVGVAASEAEAVEIAREHRPGLILADINLGAGGDGASAVSRIVRHHRAPVIFVTAYPERLLTGEAVEPAFVITKPFEPMTLAIATYQAVTGGVQLD